MIGRRLIYLAALICCLVFYICYRYWLSWFVLLLVLLLPVFSLAVSLPAMLTAKVEIKLPEAAVLGDWAEAELVTKCPLPRPPYRGGLLVQRPMTGEQWKFKNTARLPTEHCGGLSVRVTSCWVYDYLGLFRIRIRRKETGSIVVRPKAVALASPPDLGRYLAQGWRPKIGGGFAENHELRLYRPGDNLGQIHWKLTAKTGKLILREPMQPERGRAILTLDLNGSLPELDKKLGKLLWLSRILLEADVAHEIHGLTGSGVICCRVTDEASLMRTLDSLLWKPCSKSGSIQDRRIAASWMYHIGGGTNEE